MNPSRFRILALDGGGLRGIFGANLLAAVEGKSGKSISDYFDLITGTSTGAILGVGIAMGIPAKQVAALYEERRHAIFGRPRWRGTQIILGGARHDPTPLYTALQEVLGARLLKEARTRVCVPTLGAHDGKIRVLKTPHAKEYFVDGDLPAWRVAAASAAAPTFLPPIALGREETAYVDGGLWANHPGLVGLIEAIKLGVSPDAVEILSIGTGRNVISHAAPKLRGWGLLSWAKQLFELTISAQQRFTDVAIRTLQPRVYIRLDFDLPPELAAMDDPATCTRIVPLAETEFRTNYAEIERFLDAPVTSWQSTS